jgi:AcrR family transcriptional regulator
MPEPPRPLRADAERNRRRLLEAAREVFARRGLDASVDEVARAAAVGVGTLYRRFPDKAALVQAALADSSDDLLVLLKQVAGDPDAAAALDQVLRVLVRRLTDDRAFYECVHEAYAGAGWATLPRERVIGLLGEVTTRARDAGVLRADVEAMDLLSLAGLLSKLPPFRLEEQPDAWERYLAVVLDGLRPAAGQAPLPLRAPAADLVPPARASG